MRAMDAHLIASAWFGLAMHLVLAVARPSMLHPVGRTHVHLQRALPPFWDFPGV